MEEHNSPEQMIFGAMDYQYCMQLNLALYLEAWCQLGRSITRKYLFLDENDDKAPTQVKNAFS